MGFQCKEISINELKSVVREIYTADFSHVDVIHKLQLNEHTPNERLDLYVENTIKSMQEPNEKLYKVTYSTTNIAFFSIFKNGSVSILNGFHVHPEYRTSEVLSYFWECVKDRFIDELYTLIAEENIFAYKHLVRNRFQEVGEYFSKQYQLNYKIMSLCQQED